MKGAAFVVCAAVVCAAVASEPAQSSFSRQAFDARVGVREHTYRVNAKVRPLLLFWIGRDNVGERGDLGYACGVPIASGLA